MAAIYVDKENLLPTNPHQSRAAKLKFGGSSQSSIKARSKRTRTPLAPLRHENNQHDESDESEVIVNVKKPRVGDDSQSKRKRRQAGPLTVDDGGVTPLRPKQSNISALHSTTSRPPLPPSHSKPPTATPAKIVSVPAAQIAKTPLINARQQAGSDTDIKVIASTKPPRSISRRPQRTRLGGGARRGGGGEEKSAEELKKEAEQRLKELEAEEERKRKEEEERKKKEAEEEAERRRKEVEEAERKRIEEEKRKEAERKRMEQERLRAAEAAAAEAAEAERRRKEEEERRALREREKEKEKEKQKAREKEKEKQKQTGREDGYKYAIAGEEYTVIEKLGQGGSGGVYLVKDRSAKTWAMKEVPYGDGKRNPESVKAECDREINILTRLRGCGHVVHLESFVNDVAGNRYLMLMERGGNDLAHELKSLKEVRKNGKGKGRAKVKVKGKELDLSMEDPMDNPTQHELYVRTRFQQLLLPVAEMHATKAGDGIGGLLIHKDLKPANFVWFRDDSDFSADLNTLKLIDFGIAVTTDTNTLHVRQDDFAGTLQYASPESFTSKAGQAADVWSLGIMLYELIYGDTPFRHVVGLNQLFPILMSAGVDGIGKSKINLQPIKGWHESSQDQAHDLLRKCLTHDPDSRLGVAELLTHPFFTEYCAPLTSLAHHVEHVLQYLSTSRCAERFRLRRSRRSSNFNSNS